MREKIGRKLSIAEYPEDLSMKLISLGNTLQTLSSIYTGLVRTLAVIM